MNFFQENIKYLRRKLRLNQGEFALKINSTRASISDYERGKSQPNLTTLVNIAEVCSILVDDLLRKDLSLEEKVRSINVAQEPSPKYNTNTAQLNEIIEAQRQALMAKDELIAYLKKEMGKDA